MMTHVSPLGVRPSVSATTTQRAFQAPLTPTPPLQFGFDAQESGKWMVRLFYGSLVATALAAGTAALGIGYFWGKDRNPPAVQQPDQPTQQPAEVE
jgi:hypothetical protein